MAPPHLRDHHPGRTAHLAEQDHLQEALRGNHLDDDNDDGLNIGGDTEKGFIAGNPVSSAHWSSHTSQKGGWS